MTEPLRETVVYGLVKEDQILLAKRLDPQSFYFNEYVIPAGKVEKEDRLARDYLAATLLRETKEELGITPSTFRYLFSRPYLLNKVLLHFFIVTEWTGEITNLEPDKEAFDWFNITEVMQSTSTRALLDGLAAISRFLETAQVARQELINS